MFDGVETPPLFRSDLWDWKENWIFFYEEKNAGKIRINFIERRTTTSLLGRAAVGASGVRQRRREKNKNKNNNNKKKNGARKREEARAGEKREEAGREDDGEIKLGKTQSVLTDEVFGVHGADEKREADAGPLREQTPETTPAERVRRMRGRGKKENLWTFLQKGERRIASRKQTTLSETFLTR